MIIKMKFNELKREKKYIDFYPALELYGSGYLDFESLKLNNMNKQLNLNLD